METQEFLDSLATARMAVAREEAVYRAGWLPISTAPEFPDARQFVAVAINGPQGGGPCCVWRDEDGSFARWPHNFPPTHWVPLPDA